MPSQDAFACLTRDANPRFRVVTVERSQIILENGIINQNCYLCSLSECQETNRVTGDKTERRCLMIQTNDVGIKVFGRPLLMYNA